MARATRARKAALAVLGEVRRRNARARDLLRGSDALMRLDERDRAFGTRLVLGTTAALGLLDSLVDARLRRGKLEPKVRDALRMATYELLFLSTPASIAVSQGVELARLASPRSAGLANAVLRRISLEEVPHRQEVLGRVERGGLQPDDLSLASGYPSWLLSRIQRDRGAEVALDLAMAALDPAPVYVAANEATVSAGEARDLLEKAGLCPQRAEESGAFVLRNPAGLFSCGLVQDAFVVVADLSAQRVARLVAPSVDARVLEVGQGRATKTVLLCNTASRAGARVSVVGVDIEGFKVEVARERMLRAGLAERVRCVQCNARLLDTTERIPEEARGEFDLVFVDAPCSGTGTLRRHPEISWSLTEDGLDELVCLQRSILKASAARVAKGGVLAYATCSVLAAENEEVVRSFLRSEEGSAFRLLSNMFQSFPRRGEPDGHFCARLIRS
ncbi:MAG: methyltransferase domain-containing protein [Atopobiaceae bacterium]|nr:methyltransferase domain-containing protein [Atopobiaceae bacterium]